MPYLPAPTLPTCAHTLQAQQAALAGGAEPQNLDDTSAQAASVAAAAAAATMLPQVQPLQTAPPMADGSMPTDAAGLQRLYEASALTSTGMVMMPAVLPMGPNGTAEGDDGAGTSAAAGMDQASMMEMLQRHLAANAAGKRPREEQGDGDMTPEERQRKLAKQFADADTGAAAAQQNAEAVALSMGYDAASLLPQLPIFINNQQQGLSMPMAPGDAALTGDAAQQQDQQQQQGQAAPPLQVPPLPMVVAQPMDPQERMLRRCYDGVKWLLHNSDELARKKRQQARRAALNQRRAPNLVGGGMGAGALMPAGSGSSGGGLTPPGMSGGHAPDHKAMLVASLRRNLVPLVTPPAPAPLTDDTPEDGTGAVSAVTAAALGAQPAPLASLQPSSSPYWALPAPGRQLVAGGSGTPAIAELRNALPSLMPPTSAPIMPPGAGVVATAMPDASPELASLRQSLTGLVAGVGQGGEAVPESVDAAAASAAALQAAIDAGTGGVAEGAASSAVAAEGAGAAPEAAQAAAGTAAGGRGGGRGGKGGRGGRGGDDEAMIAAMSLTRMSRLDSDGEEAAEGAAAAGQDPAAAAGAEAGQGAVVGDGAAVAAGADEGAQRWAEVAAAAPTVQQLLGDSGQPGGPSVNEQVEALVRAAAAGNAYSSQSGATSSQRPRSDAHRQAGRGIQRLPTAAAAAAEPSPTGASAPQMMHAVSGAATGHMDMADALGAVMGGSGLHHQYALQAQHQLAAQYAAQHAAQQAAQQQLMAQYTAQQQLAAAAGLNGLDPASLAAMSDAERANVFSRYPQLATQPWLQQQQQRQEHGSPQHGGGAVGQQDPMQAARASEALQQQQQGMDAAGLPMMPMYVLPPHLHRLQPTLDAFPDLMQQSMADYGYMGSQSLEQQQHHALLQQQLAQQHAMQQQHHLQQLDPRSGMRRNSQGTQPHDMAAMMAGNSMFYTQQPSQQPL